MKALEKQLILKGVVSESDWPAISNAINFDFAIDNHFEEFKLAEVLQNRLQNLQNILPYIGRFYSDKWVRKNVLMQSDDDIEEMMQDIAQEGSYPQPAEDEEDVVANTVTNDTTVQQKPGTVPNIDGAGR